MASPISFSLPGRRGNALSFRGLTCSRQPLVLRMTMLYALQVPRALQRWRRHSASCACLLVDLSPHIT
eukprot:3803862-Pleurochrysis_carterae.AAC.1